MLSTEEVSVHPTVKGVLEGRDEQLQRTLELIQQRHAVKPTTRPTTQVPAAPPHSPK